MRITITADIHVGVPTKGDDIIWALKKIRQYNAEQGIINWLILGDLMHDREFICVRDLCMLTAFLEETHAKYGQRLYAFPGNHDMYLKNSWDINSLKPLSKHIRGLSNVSKIEFDGRRFWVLPFIHYESEYMRVLGSIEKRYKPGDVLLTHVGVKNALLNTCFLLKSWSVVDFTQCPFDKIFTGHFHSHQQVGDNVWYPGSPIPFKFDEGDVDHGFIVYDTDTHTHEFVSIWYGEKDSSAPPQYLTLDKASLDSIPAAEIAGNIIRVALDRGYTHNERLEIKEKLEQLGARDVRWLQSASDEDKEAIKLAKKAASSASELFERYVAADKDGTKDLNHKLLAAMNKEVVSEGDRRYDYTGDPE